MLFDALILIVGIAALVKGADWLVDGGTSLAKRLGISDLVIGLTIVSFGTSMPELLVNIIASFQGSADIAIGNIVGSNIANILLILGCTAIVTPLAVQKSTVFKEIPFSLLAAAALLIMANDAIVDGYLRSELSRSDGLAFLAFFIIFLYYTFGIRNNGHSDEEVSKAHKPIWFASALVVAGCLALAAGGKLAVVGAQSIALSLHVSEALIGLTVVAIGTSLPELVTSIVAARKGSADIAVGNVVGSNIFNIFWILGLSAVIKPLPFQPSSNADLWMVVFATALLFFFVHTGKVQNRLLFWRQKEGHRISTLEGAIMLTVYVVYMIYIAHRG